jgi:glutamate N-acetyltransferase/amino-acid N-acetyltransferase
MSSSPNAAILPSGFFACGISARIKKSGKKDLALFYSHAPCVGRAMFTANRIQAAPISVCRRHLRSGAIRGLIVNSGNANCMTGKKGEQDARDMAAWTAQALGVRPQEILVASTGIIGKPMPMQKVRRAIPGLAASLAPQGFGDAAQAILTTDTFPKMASVAVRVGGRKVIVAGVAKGAGMIAPKLRSATMLGFVFTDAAVSRAMLGEVLRESVEESFNAITIDACMSTNDTVILLANGMAGNPPILNGSVGHRAFRAAVKMVCLELAQAIVRDAEGATKFIEVCVRGARDNEEAKRLAFAVADSNLFKCAMFGSDPNWGRIAAALGAAGPDLSWEKMSIALNGQKVFAAGRPVPLRRRDLLKGSRVEAVITLGRGKGVFRVYTSDLTLDYVKINADYN